MRLGALLGPVDPDSRMSLQTQAAMLEQAGYDSLWSAHALGRGFMMTDPFVALSVAASVTERVELGTAILQLPLYEPADVALKTFSLMQVAGDRVTLGVGAGSTEVDHLVHRRDFGRRFVDFASDLSDLRACFASGQIDDLSLSPWESVSGGPRLVYGTWGAGVAKAAMEFDGWIASGMHRTVDDLEQTIVTYRAAGGTRAIVTTILLSGDTDLGELSVLLDRYRAAGFDDAVVMFMPGAPSADDVRRLVRD